MSSEEKNRLREVIIGYETAISNQSNVIYNLKYEGYLKDLIITNLNKQVDLNLKINREEKVKYFSYGVGSGIVISIPLIVFAIVK